VVRPADATVLARHGILIPLLPLGCPLFSARSRGPASAPGAGRRNRRLE
jgi:hypothetical protein